ncbi:PcfJ domain-containing protein [Bacillus cereus group sp. BfR-BA-01489]
MAIVKQMEISKDYIFEYIRDIVRMIEAIQKEIPTYEIPKLYDLEILHDVLASDMNKLEMEYEEVPYSKEEILKFEIKTPTHRFLLATSNHHLIEVGTKLNICVGSYAPEAIAKDLYIVLLEDRATGEVTHCLEFHCKRKKWSLVQAKGKYNTYPSEDISHLLIEYCMERNIRIATHDIDFESALELTS